MSVWFWFIAGLLAGLVIATIAMHLWSASAGASRPLLLRGLYAGGLIAAFAGAAVAIYLALGSPHLLAPPAGTIGAARAGGSQSTSPAKSMEAEVAGLEARLTRDGGSRADWQLLAQSYDFLGRAEDAQRARAKADAAVAAGASPAATAASTAPSAAATLSELEKQVQVHPTSVAAWHALADSYRTQRQFAQAGAAYSKLITLHGMTADSWADYADVAASLNHGSLAGAPAQAIENALKLDARQPKALWLKASFALEQHRYRDALGLWQQLRAALPPDSSDVRIVDANIAEASRLAGAPASASASPAASAVFIAGTVAIDSHLAARVDPAATLFIFAKAADSPGPPLAVLREPASGWPVSFRLDDSLAMIPGRVLSQFDKVIVEARISRSGQASPAAGDLYVTSAIVQPAAGKKLALVINREIG